MFSFCAGVWIVPRTRAAEVWQPDYSRFESIGAELVSGSNVTSVAAALEFLVSGSTYDHRNFPRNHKQSGMPGVALALDSARCLVRVGNRFRHGIGGRFADRADTCPLWRMRRMLLRRRVAAR